MVSWHSLEGLSIFLGDRLQLQAHCPQLWHGPRPWLEPPPWASSWKPGPWASLAPRWGLEHSRKLPPAVAPRPWRLQDSAASSARATAQAPQVRFQHWTQAPRGLACFLAELPQEAQRATPFPLFPELAGSTKRNGPSQAAGASRTAQGKPGPATPQFPQLQTGTLPRPQSQPRCVLPAVPKPSRENSEALTEPALSLSALVTEARPGQGVGGREVGRAAFGLGADAVHTRLLEGWRIT